MRIKRHFARKLLGTICGATYRVISVNRVKGNNFLLAPPNLLRIRRGGVVMIGSGVVIGSSARISVIDKRLVIGADTFISKNVTLVAFDDVLIGKRVLIGENVSFHTENHGPSNDRSRYSIGPILIEDDVWIGAGAVILKNVRVGTGSTIGANAVVTKDVPANSIAVGIPATSRPLT